MLTKEFLAPLRDPFFLVKSQAMGKTSNLIEAVEVVSAGVDLASGRFEIPLANWSAITPRKYARGQ